MNADMGNEFILFEDNVSHLDGVMINSCEYDEDKEDELNRLVFNDDGSLKNVITREQFIDEIRQGSILIECGFLP